MNQVEISLSETPRTGAYQAAFDQAWQTGLDQAIASFQPISLKEMDSVALLNRFDTKYVMSTAQLFVALRSLRRRYQILTINGQKAHHYRTLYFDTPGFDLYHDHITGRSQVYKVRSREYVDTRLAYLEIKHKNQKKRTEKSRLPVAYRCSDLDREMEQFLKSFPSFTGRELEPKLWNTFKRITLVSKTDLERLTIDLDLCFYNGRELLDLEGVAIAEVKQDQVSRGSAFAAEMRRQGIRPSGFSKYCYGVSRLYASVKKNPLKERALLIEKIQRGEPKHGYIA